MRRVINPTGRHALYSRGLTIVLSFLLYCVGSAGYYSVSYDLSDCTVSITGPSSGWQHGYGVSNGTASGSDISHDYVAPPLEAMASYGSVVCEGEIVVTFTWQPSFAGEEPPQVAVVKKVASAVWSGKDGASDNGLDDEAAVYIDGGSCSGTHYEVVENPGFTFERAISPSASGSLPSTGWFGLECASAGVSVTFSAIPVTIESNFALRLGNDFAFLIGQQADFYIAGTGLTFDQHSWTPGHTAIGDVELSGHTVNNVEAAGSLYPSGQWSYYETRETHPVTNLGSSNPSWFYEGAQNLRRRVHSTFRIKVGSVVLDSVTISRRLQVYAPIIRSTSIPGPVSILDANPAQTNDEEFAQAGKVGGAPGFVVISQILLPVEFASGNGKWAYVHLIRSEIWNGTSTSYFPKGLDNLYPYPSSTDGLSDPYRIDWKPLGGTSNRLTFSDSPSYSISTLSAYVDSMEGWCFAVIRPPVQQGQDWVDLPIMLQPWTYESESLRTPQTKWIQTSLYTYVGSNLWETIPICPGVQKGTISYYVLSEDMDWDYVFGNQ